MSEESDTGLARTLVEAERAKRPAVRMVRESFIVVDLVLSSGEF